MSKQSGSACFGLKARKKFRTSEAGAFLGETNGFDGNIAADDRIDGEVDDTHGAASELAQNFIASGFYDRFHQVPPRAGGLS